MSFANDMTRDSFNYAINHILTKCSNANWKIYPDNTIKTDKGEAVFSEKSGGIKVVPAATYIQFNRAHTEGKNTLNKTYRKNWPSTLKKVIPDEESLNKATSYISKTSALLMVGM